MENERLTKLLETAGIKTPIEDTCSIEHLRPRHLTYIADPAYAECIKPDKKAVILCAPQCGSSIVSIAGNEVVAHPAAALLFFRIHNELHRVMPAISYAGPWMRRYPDACISTQAVVGEGFSPGRGVTVAPFAVVGNDVTLGEDSFVHSGAVIGDRCRIGRSCMLAPHCVIGNPGFRVFREEDGSPQRLKHKAAVVLGDHVDLGSFSAVDRGLFEDTVIGDLVKLDNHVHVGHNAIVGAGSLLCAGSIVGGSTVIEENVWLGLNATTADHLVVGEHAYLSMGAIVTKNVEAHGRVSGNFAIDHKRLISFIKSIS